MPKKTSVHINTEYTRPRKLANESEKKSMKKGNKVPKVTEAELRRIKEEEEKMFLKKADEFKKKKIMRVASEEEYEKMVLVSNCNRDDSIIDARSVDEALEKFTVADDDLSVDRHPERRLKASFKAFEEEELRRLKVEKPGLLLNQYNEMILKLWKKSPKSLSTRNFSNRLRKRDCKASGASKVDHHPSIPY